MSPSSRKDESDKKDESDITIEALGEEAARSVTKSVEQEQKERAPQPTKKGGPIPGMPSETDFTTPRVHQGSEGEGNRQTDANRREGEGRPRDRR